VQTCRHELLDRTLIWNLRHLLHALRVYEQFYNAHRPHQAIANTRPLQPLPCPITDPLHITSLDITSGRPQRPARMRFSASATSAGGQRQITVFGPPDWSDQALAALPFAFGGVAFHAGDDAFDDDVLLRLGNITKSCTAEPLSLAAVNGQMRCCGGGSRIASRQSITDQRHSGRGRVGGAVPRVAVRHAMLVVARIPRSDTVPRRRNAANP
jgi:hypothetical protein